MFNWFKKKEEPLTPQQQLKKFVDSLKNYPVQLHNRPKVYTYEPTQQSVKPFEDLKGCLEAYVELVQLAIKHYERLKQPLAAVIFPMQEDKLNIWDFEYYELMQRGAKYYGLKVRQNETGSWEVRRCLNCNICTERVECLSFER